MAPRVYLHIGAPKTGTTYLQDKFSLNARNLARHGVVVPTVSPFISPDLAQFRAALDLLDMDWGGPAGHADGYWDRLVRKAQRVDGTVLISHEILSPASPEKVAQALHALDDPDAHIIYTARDLSQQLASAWQESIKRGRKWTFRRFLRRAREHRIPFMAAFDLPEVLGTWGKGLPSGHLHVVTVPHDSTAQDTLWLRFCEAIRIDPAWAPRGAQRLNKSLGAADTLLLRALNRRGGADGSTREFRDAYVDTLVTRGNLGRSQVIPIELPPEDVGWVRAEVQGWLEWLDSHDVVVHGDPQDLVPQERRPDQTWIDPDQLGNRVLLNGALDALHALAVAGQQDATPRERLVAHARATPFVRRFL